MADKFYIIDDNGSTYIYKQPEAIEFKVNFDELPTEIQDFLTKEAARTGEDIEAVLSRTAEVALKEHFENRFKKIVEAAKKRIKEKEQQRGTDNETK